MTKNIISEDPLVYTIDNFLTKEECDYFITNSKDKVIQALVSSNKEGVVSDGRTGKNHWIKHDESDITKEIGERIAREVGIPLVNAEAFQVIYYDVNQEYKKHFDAWDLDYSEKSIRNMKYGGQRMITALVYLNIVEEGGGTRFTKLDKEVSPEIGKMLVFHNVYSGKNIKHALSEHAGMPVIKGEKWAFNLWFREEPRNKLFNYPKKEQPGNTIVDISDSISEKIKISREFFDEKDFFSLNTEKIILQSSDKTSIWLDNRVENKIVDSISKLISVDKNFFESICVTKYKPGYIHRFHHDSYNLETDIGKKYTSDRGQRLITVTGFLTPTLINFNKLKQVINCDKGDIIHYNNCFSETNLRNCNLEKSYTPLDPENEMILFNIYIREYYDNKRFKLVVKNSDKNIIEKFPPVVDLNYDDIKKDFYKNFLNIDKSFKLVNKVPIDYINTSLSVINKHIENGTSFLNPENLEKEYYMDEFTPVTVENVISSSIHNLVNNYFKHNIKNEVFPFGDRQSNRFKILDETFTRLLHLEFLPLIEKIVGKKMKPTYTYLSCYVKGADLPAHTDREECEYTCSYIIGKPKNTNWNIYVHKVKQPVKHVGRYTNLPNGEPGFVPPKEECIAVDCEENGLMLFNGTDHIHYREPLEHDYYNIVLLHYCSK